MSLINLHDVEPAFEVERTSDEHADVQLRIRTNEDLVILDVGHIHGDVEYLRDSLKELVDKLDNEILNGWVDTPDDEDGYLGVDRGRYYATLAGKPLGGREGFPTLDIAAYRLAETMVETGDFSNVWYESERGGVEPFTHDLFDFTEDGDGTAVVPLAGVQYEPGDVVHIRGGDWPMVVDRDYGQYGVVMHTEGDPTIREHVPHENRDQLTKIDEEGGE